MTSEALWPGEFMGRPTDETTVFEWDLRLPDPVPARSGSIRDAVQLVQEDEVGHRVALVWDPVAVERLVTEFADCARRNARTTDVHVLAAFYVASLVEPDVDVEELESVVFGHRPHGEQGETVESP